MTSYKGFQGTKVRSNNLCPKKSTYPHAHRMGVLVLMLILVSSILQPAIAGPSKTGYRLSETELKSEVPGKSIPGVDFLLAPFMMDTIFTVRFSTPTFNCNTDEYCVNVEFQCNISNFEVFGMNVRFWYDDSKLEFVNFRNFVGSYVASPPNPPNISTSTSFGGAMGFGGAAEYINGAMQLNNVNATPIIISTTGWTKLYEICFTIDDPNPNVNSYCPSLVWDLEANPANGGFLPGSDGVVISGMNSSNQTFPVKENVDQYNWMYIGNGAPPYGQPFNEVCSSINCAPTITCPANVDLACGASTLPSNTGSATATDLCNGDPVLTYNDNVNGGPCPLPSTINRTWTATDNCGNSSTCLQIITVGGGSGCNLVVTSTANSGTGSLRDAIACADPLDTITFATSLGGQTITLTSKILMNKSLFIRSNVTPRIKLTTTGSDGIFDVAAGTTIEFKDLDVTSGTTCPTNVGAVYENSGNLKLIGMKVFRHPSLPTNRYLIRNKPGSQLSLTGACYIETN